MIYENVVKGMSDGVLIIGFDGKIRMENAVVSEILGYSKESLYGRTIASLMEEDDRLCLKAARLVKKERKA